MSAAEFLVGAFIVIGHNVFRILPNEVPILFVLGMISIRLRNGSFSAMGFKRPESWIRILAIALVAAALRYVVGEYVIPPLTAHFWPAATGPAEAENITGNIKFALLALLVVWTFAAFGEEISYRGYLLTRASEGGGSSKAAYVMAVILSSVLFGYGHYYKGMSGVIDSGVAGLILGSAYLLSGRILWTTILAHGFIDTFGIIMIFFGWAKAN
jgi:membrane protease YdiL (CAAX protease family)